MDGLGLRSNELVERNGGEEVGDGAIDYAHGAELVGGCEVGAGEGRERQTQAPRGLEVEKCCGSQSLS